MPLVFDHRDPANVKQYYGDPGKCISIPGIASLPVDAPPVELGIYPAGVDDQLPPGHAVVSSERVVVNGVSKLVLTTAAVEPLEPVDPLQSAAEAILADEDAVAAVQGVIARVTAVAALGVDITEWSFEGVTAAAEAAAAKTEVPTRLDILTAAVALRTAWDRLLYHCESMRQADTLWPYMYAIVTAPVVAPGDVDPEPAGPAEPLEP